MISERAARELDDVELARLVMLTTKTAANADATEDDRDDDRFELFSAMTTTLTESTGDSESDQDDRNHNSPSALAAGGNRLPLAYRFAESVPSLQPDLCYDSATQMHISKRGEPLVTLFRRRLSSG